MGIPFNLDCGESTVVEEPIRKWENDIVNCVRCGLITGAPLFLFCKGLKLYQEYISKEI
jgi:hypothetical protein